jgi:hypothetical protein
MFVTRITLQVTCESQGEKPTITAKVAGLPHLNPATNMSITLNGAMHPYLYPNRRQCDIKSIVRVVFFFFFFFFLAILGFQLRTWGLHTP